VAGTYAGAVAVGDRVDQYRALARRALQDLLDQRRPFGRLALVQVFMLAGTTLVTISLAGSLFFSISPDEAKSKVFLYLVLTLAPFAVVSPLLGPLIDRSRGARRAMVVSAAIGGAVVCPFMARDIHSLLLFPEAFLILVISNLYLVTRNALVPEMVLAEGRSGEPGTRHGQPGAPAPPEFSALNARLTLLGTLAGFAASLPGIVLLEAVGAPAVLVLAVFAYAAAAVAGLRLPVPGRRRRLSTPRSTPRFAAGSRPPGGAVPDGPVAAPWAAPADHDLARLQPAAHPEVLFGLTTVSLVRGLSGFMVFLVAFGLRREHAGLYWYGLALGASGLGALLGLVVMSRLRQRLTEQQVLLAAIWLVAVGAAAAAAWGTVTAQVMLALFVGFAGSLAEPSFAAIAQRYVPLPAQGRAFARFATRQQLVWVLGAIVPVVVAMAFPAGDVVMAAVAGAGGLFYVTSRKALRHRALPRPVRDDVRRRAGDP
jgi:Major Facilitator Superfamily